MNGASHPFRKDGSEIVVIDTAIVRSLGGSFTFPPTPADTTRHVYSFDANAQRTSDLVQKLSDDQGNLTSLWHYSWLDSSWTPSDIMLVFRGYGYLGTATDSAGNSYYFGQGYSFAFTHRLVTTGIALEGGHGPASYTLSQNYPNPFNPNTTIEYEVPMSSEVRLSVYDMLGREVSVLVNEKRDAGIHEVQFEASHLASGVYLYRLQAGSYAGTRKLVLVR
jgi:Secretion system C-terminal sorting domain